MEQTVGQLLVQEHLPDDLKHYANKPLDKKGIGELFTALTKRPEVYNDVASNIARLGFELSTVEGSSVSLDDLKSPIDKNKRFRDVEKEVEEIKKKKLPKQQERNEIIDKYQNMVSNLDKDVLEAGIQKGISLAKTIRAGSRGSSGQYRATVAAPGLVVDADSNPIYEVPVEHSFAEGLSLPEYLASSFSARSSEISKKLGVADSGYFAKVLSRGGITTQIEEHDCNTNNGITVPVADKDSIGCFLAHPIEEYKKNTEIKPEVLADLANKKINNIVIRSPLTCESSRHYHPNAVCQLCVGIRENGLPELKSFVGVIAAASISEPLSQSLLGAKHCILHDSLVKMADFSEKKIEDIKVGDEVIGADNQGNTFSTKVLDVIDQGLQDCYKYTFGIGSKRNYDIKIVATKDHVCLANAKVSMQKGEEDNHSITLRKIGEKRDKWYLVPPTNYTENENTVEEEFALIIGLLIGDGGLRHGVFLTCFDESLISEIQPYLQKLKLRAEARPSKPNEFRVSNLQKGARKKSPLYNKLEQYNLLGKYSYEKELPSNIMNWSKESAAALLGGLFSADGSIYIQHYKKGNDKIHFSIGLSSEKAVNQIRDLLFWKFSIICEVQYKKTKGKSLGINHKGKTDYVSKSDTWKINITDDYNVNRLMDFIPFVGVKKRKIEEYQKTHRNKHFQDFYTFKRRKIENVGFRHCYDLTVDCSDNLFVLANGAIVHNSQQSIGAAKQLSSGFELINQLANIPKNFPGEAALASVDGKITDIKPVSTGGNHIYVNGIEHFVEPGIKVIVKKGDAVEQGDLLTEGIVNPSDIVKYKGIGEGRKVYTELMHKAFKDSGIPVNRRNMEIVAKSAIDHVKITDPEGLGDYLPDQIVSYQNLAKDYVPPKNAVNTRIDKTYGKYIQEPVLHYTIGTRVDKNVQNHLSNQKIESVLVSEEPPGFHPEMQRLLDLPEHSDDFFGKLYSTYIDKRMTDAVNTGIGSGSSLSGPNPILGIAYGKGFGDTLKPLQKK